MERKRNKRKEYGNENENENETKTKRQDDAWVLSGSADKTTAFVPVPAVRPAGHTVRNLLLLMLNVLLVVFLYHFFAVVHGEELSTGL